MAPFSAFSLSFLAEAFAQNGHRLPTAGGGRESVYPAEPLREAWLKQVLFHEHI